MALALSTFSSRIERLELSNKLRTARNIEMLDNYSFRLFDADGNVTKTYVPNKSGLQFHASDAYVKLELGPFGSGKSTTNLTDIVIRACNMPECDDGIRRMKVMVVRNTSGELETSTLASWQIWFSELGDIHKRKKPVLTWEHTFNDGFGRIELTLVFLALDRPDDFGKIKSTEFTLAYLNEASELPDGLLDFVKGRVTGRYPSAAMCSKPYHYGIILDSNPPDDEHWIYRTFETEKPNGYLIIKQPSGLLIDITTGEPAINPETSNYIANPDAENVGVGIPHDYYVKIAQGADKEFIKVYCCGFYGLIKHGEVVYPTYNDNLHSVERIDLTPGEAIYLGWDFGNTPACLVSQYVDGQLRFIKEFVSKFNTSTQELVEERVKPWLDQFCLGYTIYSDHDPSDPDASSTGIAPSQTLEAAGIDSQPAVSNLLQPRLDAMKFFLGRLVGGKPACLVSRSGCPVLRSGLYGKYIFHYVHRYGEKTPHKEPKKTHPISDIQDGAQYIALRLHAVVNEIETDSDSFLMPAGNGGFI